MYVRAQAKKTNEELRRSKIHKTLNPNPNPNSSWVGEVPKPFAIDFSEVPWRHTTGMVGK